MTGYRVAMTRLHTGSGRACAWPGRYSECDARAVARAKIARISFASWPPAMRAIPEAGELLAYILTDDQGRARYRVAVLTA